jgi:broad specificity phosphatase PhoE
MNLQARDDDSVEGGNPMEGEARAVTPTPLPVLRGDSGDGPARLYLVRHGTTTMNRENRYRGRRDVALDAQGYQDAVDAARFLSDRALTAVYAGPLRRTIFTAQIIADEARVPDVRIMHGLINLDYGIWEGMTAEEAEAHDPVAFASYREDPLRCVCPDGERLNQGQDRMLDALLLIGGRHRGESVAVVSHAVMIRLVLARLLDLPGEKWRVPLGRGSITEFEVGEDGIRAGARLLGGSEDDPLRPSIHRRAASRE